MRTIRVCQGALDHRPLYAEVDRHHIYPNYLAHLLGVPERSETTDLCSGCHDLIHHLLYHFISEGELPGHSTLPANVRALVERAYDWWVGALLAASGP